MLPGASLSVKILAMARKTVKPGMTPAAARELAESWITHLEAERKSPHTIRAYGYGVELYVRWCEAEGRRVELSRGAVETWTAGLLAGGNEANTVINRQRGVKRFSAWLADEGEIPADELVSLRQPKADDKIPDTLTEEQLAALIATCEGKDREFHDTRDAAILRVMADSMVRSDELLSMTVDGVDIRRKTAVVARGKGGKGRVVAFGPDAARALDRYMRMRRRHRLADSPYLWLPTRRSSENHFAYGGLYISLRRRAARCGFELHPHMLRSYGAIQWRRKGGSVPALLTLAGWSSLDMAQRYVKAAETELAIEEAHRLMGG
jgi:site-specific recombinase XerD